MKPLLISLAVLSVVACSNQAAYENMQINQRNDCSTLPPSQYDACMEAAKKSYEDYERQRQEALNNNAE